MKIRVAVKQAITALSLLFLLIGCSGNNKVSTAVNKLSPEQLLTGQTDSIYKQIKAFPNNTQFAIALIRNGEVTFYGTKRNNDTLTTIGNSSSVFEIGSISKVFTATLLANFVLDKELELDSPINKHFDYTFHENQTFTFRELANHSSGLPRLPSNIRFTAIFNPGNPYKKYDEEKLDEYLQDDISLDYPKGSKSEYSNLGMGLLSYTLRKYSKKSYEELIQGKILSRYNMSNTTSDKSKIKGSLVAGLDDDGESTQNWDSGALIGAGGIYSTVEDLSKFALAQLDSTNKELALTRIKTFKETDTRDVGLGWFIMNRKNGDKWYWHNGGTGGYTSSMAIDVENKNGVIVLSNISSYHKDFGNIDRLCFSLLKTLR